MSKRNQFGMENLKNESLEMIDSLKLVIIEAKGPYYLKIYFLSGLHKLCHLTIRDGSTWSKFGARGEHGDVFLFSNLVAL